MGNTVTGIISEVQREQYTVLVDHKEIQAKLKGSFYKTGGVYPVIGDVVELQWNGAGVSLIEKVCTRRSIFRRPDQSGHAAGYVKTMKEQILAANFDYVFITASLNSNYNLNRITRYVTITLQTGARPVVVLTKADLCEDRDKYLQEVKAISENVAAFAVSDCRHEKEPGCAIRQALESGELSKARYELYCSLQAESNWAADKKQSVKAQSARIQQKISQRKMLRSRR